jgi:hypothetical protein
MEDARPELVPTAQAWVKWAEEYLEEHHPADALFFEPLVRLPGWRAARGAADRMLARDVEASRLLRERLCCRQKAVPVTKCQD